MSNVSRETEEKLSLYHDLLLKWADAINLVSPGTLAAFHERHLKDSLQLLDIAGEDWNTWCDLGSGAGFPGMVIAIAAKRAQTVHLIESDKRKSSFLRAVARETGARAVIHPQRIEVAPPQEADIVSARALAHLDKLLPFVRRHMSSQGRALLPKGETWKKELAETPDISAYSYQTHESTTNPRAVVFEITKRDG